MEQMFRCPFEVKGIEEETIIVHELPEAQEQRFELLRRVLERFHRNHRWSAVRLVLPHSVWGACRSNQDLKPVILPYQAEVIAALLDDQLFPLLPHHDEARHTLEGLGLRLPFSDRESKLLRKFFGDRTFRTVKDLSTYLAELFKDGKAYELRGRKSDGPFGPYVLLSLGTVQIGEDPLKNIFTIVKSPFYPYALGRYSERVEIVLTRHHDIDRLSESTKLRIRVQANQVCAAHGIPILDESIDQQTAGLWIPEEALKLVIVE